MQYSRLSSTVVIFHRTLGRRRHPWEIVHICHICACITPCICYITCSILTKKLVAEYIHYPPRNRSIDGSNGYPLVRSPAGSSTKQTLLALGWYQGIISATYYKKNKPPAYNVGIISGQHSIKQSINRFESLLRANNEGQLQ